MRLILIVLLAASMLQAAPRRAWWVSVGAFVTANLIDTHSSWGAMEANPLMRSRNGGFGVRSVAIKGGSMAALVAVEYLLIRRRPTLARGFTAGNFGAAGFLGAVAVRNYKVAQ